MAAGTEQVATTNSRVGKAPRVSPALEEKPVSHSAAEHGGIYTHFRQLAALSGSAKPPPGRFASFFETSEFAHPANDAQKIRVVYAMQEQYGNRYVGQVLQRKCECGGSCSSCSGSQEDEEKKFLQRYGEGEPASLPDTLGRTMQGSGAGSPLDSGTRSTMESRFGHRFDDVRVHTDSSASDAARQVRARAFTTGRDIYFGAGRYQPYTREGKHLLAHELTHVVQQRSGAVRSGMASLRVNTPGDVFELEADTAANQVAEGRAVTVGGVSAGRAQVQRYSWDEFVEDVEGVGSRVVGAAEEALDWTLTMAGRAAISGANALAGLFGGTVVVRGGCVIITIPEIPLFPSFQKNLGETPPIGFFIPLLEGGTMVGPFPVAGMFGILGYAQGSLEGAVGPGRLRGISVTLCPLSGSYSGTAQLYVAAAIGPRLTLFGGLAAVVGTAIPVTPPIPIIAILQGGLRGTGTGWLIGAVQDTVTLAYSAGVLSFNNVTDFMAGVLLQGDVDLFAALRLYEKIICQYVYPLGHWETGRAWKLTIPISASLGGGASAGGVGPITWGPMPISDIETAIHPLTRGWNCLSWAEIKEILCDNHVLPPSMCEEEDDEHKALRKQLALAICKCVETKQGKNCGAGIYRKCFSVEDNVCKNYGELLKQAQSRCNHNLPECKQPGCRMKHVDAKCPVKESECKDGYFGGETVTPQAAPCPVPQRFRQTAGGDAGGGVLHFEYKWDSSTGKLADLSDCEVGEHVLYTQTEDPPFAAAPNPTVIWLPGEDGELQDNHSPGTVKPYKVSTEKATQHYRYRCPCSNSGNPVNLLGPISLIRQITQRADGKFKYKMTKSGKTAEIDPLP